MEYVAHILTSQRFRVLHVDTSIAVLWNEPAEPNADINDRDTETIDRASYDAEYVTL